MTSVSIVTPSYNQGDFIEETVKSVRRQSHSDVTHIVIDGESNDGTISVFKKYPDLDWVSEPDRGQTHAINKGFEKASGDIVGWLNSDDLYVYKNTIEEVVRKFERTCADIIFGHAITIGPNTELLRAHYVPRFDSEKLKRHCYIIQPSVFFRKDVIKENKLNEDRDYSMDYEFWLDLSEDYNWNRFNGIISADRNHPNRKIIKNANESKADTASLRKERDIESNHLFSQRQYFDKLDLRWRRFRMLPNLLDLYFEPQSNLAADLEKPPLARLLRTQLIGRKKKL